MKAVVACTLLLMAMWAADADARPIAVKVGGGALVTNTVRPGFFGSIEIPISEDYPTHIAPFLEVYSRNGITLMPMGAAILYKARLSDYGGQIFFGAGGGLILTRGDVLGVSVDDTNGLIGAMGGLSLGLGDRLGAFAQARWLRPFEDETADNDLGFHVGLTFEFGG